MPTAARSEIVPMAVLLSPHKAGFFGRDPLPKHLKGAPQNYLPISRKSSWALIHDRQYNPLNKPSISDTRGFSPVIAEEDPQTSEWLWAPPQNHETGKQHWIVSAPSHTAPQHLKSVYVYKDWGERMSTGDFHPQMRDVMPPPKNFRENTMSPIKWFKANLLITNDVCSTLKRQNIPPFLAPAPCGKN